MEQYIEIYRKALEIQRKQTARFGKRVAAFHGSVSAHGEGTKSGRHNHLLEKAPPRVTVMSEVVVLARIPIHGSCVDPPRIPLTL